MSAASLEEEISKASHDIHKDGYDMSIGEIISSYNDGEIRIRPEYQRNFRWEEDQKTKFIESILIGIPIPPIFVFTSGDGKWELIDGLQRISTILEFTGKLAQADGGKPQIALGKSKLIPSLYGKTWDELPDSVKLMIRRTRIRVEILKKESDPRSRYELFVRLNTGGSTLSEQEVRSCLLEMTSHDAYAKIKAISSKESFSEICQLTENAVDRQKDIELIIRVLVYRNTTYDGSSDIHDFLNDAIIDLVEKLGDKLDGELALIAEAIELIRSELGEGAFKRRKDGSPTGQFLISSFEAIMLGVTNNISIYRANPSLVTTKCNDLWSALWFTTVAKGGVRGTTRLAAIVSNATTHFA